MRWVACLRRRGKLVSVNFRLQMESFWEPDLKNQYSKFFGGNNLREVCFLRGLFFCYTRLLIPLANYQHMGVVEEGSVDYFKQEFDRKGLHWVSSNFLWKLDIPIWKLFFRWQLYDQHKEKQVPCVRTASANFRWFTTTTSTFAVSKCALRPSLNLSFGEWLTDFQSSLEY